MLGNMTSPVVLPTVSYQNMRCRQRQGVKLPRRWSPFFEHQRGRERGLSGPVNESQLLINVVNANQPQRLTGSNQKGAWSSVVVTTSTAVAGAPPAKRPHLTHSGTSAGRGKPVALPWRGSKSQDAPVAMRASDNRQSRRQLGMSWRGSEDTRRKPADCGVGRSRRERMSKPLWRGKQMWAGSTLAGPSLTVSAGVDHIIRYRIGHGWSDRIW